MRKYIDFTTLNVRPYTSRGVTSIEARVPAYLTETLSRLVPAYQAEKNSGGDRYATN